jgi:hypothetical protein
MKKQKRKGKKRAGVLPSNTAKTIVEITAPVSEKIEDKEMGEMGSESFQTTTENSAAGKVRVPILEENIAKKQPEFALDLEKTLAEVPAEKDEERRTEKYGFAEYTNRNQDSPQKYQNPVRSPTVQQWKPEHGPRRVSEITQRQSATNWVNKPLQETRMEDSQEIDRGYLTQNVERITPDEIRTRRREENPFLHDIDLAKYNQR